MNKSVWITKVLPVLVAGLLICSFFEFLAYTDIYHDYVSKNVIEKISPLFLNKLPDWSDTSGEWSIANMSLLIRTLLTVLLLILTLRLSSVKRT